MILPNVKKFSVINTDKGSIGTMLSNNINTHPNSAPHEPSKFSKFIINSFNASNTSI